MAFGSKAALSIIIRAKDEASKDVAKAEKAFGSLGTVSKVAIGGVAALGAAMVGVGVAAVKLAQDAAHIPGIANAFESLGGSIEAMREGTAGMVTDAELMKTYNKAAQLVGKTFADELPAAMEYLSKVSAATGEDIGYMLNSLTVGVGRLSPMILDNLGIQVSLAEATARASEMFGIEADQLSKTQQQAGMMNVVMEKLKENTAGMEGVTGTAQQAFGSLSTTFQNIKDDIGVQLLPSMGDMATQLGELAEECLPAILEAGLAFSDWLMDTAVPALTELILFLTEGSDAVMEFRQSLADGKNTYDAYTDATMRTKEALGLMALGMSYAQAKDELLRMGLLMSEGAWERNAFQTEVADIKMQNAAIAAERMGGALLDTSADTNAATDAMSGYTAAVWAAQVAEDAFFGGWGSEHIATPTDIGEVEEAAAAAGTAAAQAASAAYNAEMQDLRLESARISLQGAMAELPAVLAEAGARIGEALSSFHDYEGVSGEWLGKRVDNLVWGLGVLTRKLVPELQALAKQFGAEGLVAAEELSQSVTGTLGVLGKMGDVLDFHEYEGLSGAWLEDRVKNYGWAMRTIAVNLIDELRKLKKQYGVDVLAEAGDLSESVMDVLDILDFVKLTNELQDYQGIPAGVISDFVDTVGVTLDELIDMANNLQNEIDEGTEAALSTMGASGGAMGSILDFFQKLIGVGGEEEGYQTLFDDNMTLWSAYKSDLETLVDEMSDWDLKADMDNLTAIEERLGLVEDIWGSVANTVKNIKTMVKEGGVDLWGAQALMGELGSLMTIPGFNWSEMGGQAPVGTGAGGGMGGGAYYYIPVTIMPNAVRGDEDVEQIISGIIEYLELHGFRATGT